MPPVRRPQCLTAWPTSATPPSPTWPGEGGDILGRRTMRATVRYLLCGGLLDRVRLPCSHPVCPHIERCSPATRPGMIWKTYHAGDRFACSYLGRRLPAAGLLSPGGRRLGRQGSGPHAGNDHAEASEGLVDEDGDDFVANMDRAGIDATMVMMLDVGRPSSARSRTFAWKADRILFRSRGAIRVACSAMSRWISADPNHLDLIRRRRRPSGLAGIGEITPDGFSAADEAIRPLMKLAVDLGVPVQIHTRTGVWTDLAGTDFSEAIRCIRFMSRGWRANCPT
jgi:hypothetical protein